MPSEGNRTISQHWLEQFVVSAIQRKLCTKCHCTTCGSREFRSELLALAAAAAGQKPGTRMNADLAASCIDELAALNPALGQSLIFTQPVRFIFCAIWDALGDEVAEKTLAPRLVGTWAGAILTEMQAHHLERLNARRQQEAFESSEQVVFRRSEKLRLRQEAHKLRLEAKKKRDRLWREQKQHP